MSFLALFLLIQEIKTKEGFQIFAVRYKRTTILKTFVSDINCVELWKCSPFFPVPYFKITKFKNVDNSTFIRIQCNDPDRNSRKDYYFGEEQYENGDLEIGKWYQLATAYAYLQFKSESGQASFQLEFECRRIEYLSNHLGKLLK